MLKGNMSPPFLQGWEIKLQSKISQRKHLCTQSEHQRVRVVWWTLDQRVKTAYFRSWLMTTHNWKLISWFFWAISSERKKERGKEGQAMHEQSSKPLSLILIHQTSLSWRIKPLPKKQHNLVVRTTRLKDQNPWSQTAKPPHATSTTSGKLGNHCKPVSLSVKR